MRLMESITSTLLFRGDTGLSRTVGSAPGRQIHEQRPGLMIFKKKEKNVEIYDNYAF